MDLGARIKAWLHIRGIKQAALAREVGVTPAAVTAWVKHGKPLTQKNLSAVCEALGLSMAEFYGALPKSRTRAAA